MVLFLPCPLFLRVPRARHFPEDSTQGVREERRKKAAATGKIPNRLLFNSSGGNLSRYESKEKA